MRNKQFVFNGLKECTACKAFKLLSDFYQEKNNSSGKKSECKDCYDYAYNKKAFGVSMQVVIDGRKICTYCKEMKPLDDFFIDKRLSSNRSSRCKGCARIGWKSSYKQKSHLCPGIDCKTIVNGGRRLCDNHSMTTKPIKFRPSF